MFKQHHNKLIALALILLNIFAWWRMLNKAPEPHIVDPIRDEEVVQLLDYIRAGDDHSGETWTVTLSELEAEQTITWYLDRYPQIPFEYPEVEITSDYVAGRGFATLAGLRVYVGGKARITLKNGLPIVEILDLSIPVPPSIRNALEAEIQRQLRRADTLPVRFSSAEWGDGVVTVTGTIR